MRSEIVEGIKSDKAKAVMSLFSGKGSEIGAKARDNLIANIVKHPLRSVGIAAITGCLATFLLKKKHK